MTEVFSSRGTGVPFSLAIKILKCEKKVNGDLLLVVRNFKKNPLEVPKSRFVGMNEIHFHP